MLNMLILYYALTADFVEIACLFYFELSNGNERSNAR